MNKHGWMFTRLICLVVILGFAGCKGKGGEQGLEQAPPAATAPESTGAPAPAPQAAPESATGQAPATETPPETPAPQPASQTSGEELFKEHCAVCHPDGSNVITPDKTLRKSALEANGIKTPDDVVAKMRNPGPGMTPFDETRIPQADARKIAEYVLETFQ